MFAGLDEDHDLPTMVDGSPVPTKDPWFPINNYDTHKWRGRWIEIWIVSYHKETSEFQHLDWISFEPMFMS